MAIFSRDSISATVYRTETCLVAFFKLKTYLSKEGNDTYVALYFLRNRLPNTGLTPRRKQYISLDAKKIKLFASKANISKVTRL